MELSGTAIHSGVHLVAGDLFALHRFESTGSDVQCEFVALYAVTVESLQHLVP